MATIKETNAKLFDTMKDEKHFQHAVYNSFFYEMFRRGGFDIWQMAICPSCEKLAGYIEDGRAYCPHCGKVSTNPMTFGEFYETGYHVDRLMHKDAPQYVDHERADSISTVYGGEAGLRDKDKKIIVTGG